MNSYTANTTVRMSVVITDLIDGAPIDPTTVTLKATLPDGTVADLSSTLQHPSTGNYYADYLPTVPGVYQYQFLGSGVVGVSAFGQFLVTQATI